MFCPKCGTGNEESARFCEKCGAPLIDNTVQAPQPAMTAPQPEMTAPQPEMTAPQPEMTAPQPAMTVQPQPGMAAALAPKKPVSPAVIKIAIAAAAAVVLIIIFVVTGSILSNPKRIVEKYFAAASKGDWGKVYNYVDIPKGEFITKDLMAKAFSEEDTYDITNFEVVENKFNDSKISKEYFVTYYRTGSSKGTTTVELVRAGKFLLFWDNYKVSASDVVVKDTQFTVREGSKLIIDDVEVADSYIDAGASTDGSHVTKYKIDYLFGGSHKVRATHNMYEDIEKEYTLVSDGKSYQLQASEVKENIKSEREGAAQNDMRTFFAAAIANKGFEEVQNLCVPDASSVKSAYSTFQSRTYNNGYGVTKIDFKNMTSSSTTGTKAGELYIRVSVKAEVEATVNSKSGSSTNVKPVKDTLNSSFTYTYTNGEWKISSVTLDRVLFF